MLPTPPSFAVLWTLQRACETDLATLDMGQSIAVPEAIAGHCIRDALQFYPNHGAGERVLQSPVRQVNRQDKRWRA